MTDHTDPIPDIVDRIDQMLALYARRSVPGAVPGTVSLLRDLRRALTRPVVADPATPTTPDGQWTAVEHPDAATHVLYGDTVAAIIYRPWGLDLAQRIADALNAARPAPDVLLTGTVTAMDQGTEFEEDITVSTDEPVAATHVSLLGRRVVVTAAPTEDTNHGH